MVFAIGGNLQQPRLYVKFEYYGLCLWMPLVLKSFCSERWCGGSGQTCQGLSFPGSLSLHHEFGIYLCSYQYIWMFLPPSPVENCSWAQVVCGCSLMISVWSFLDPVTVVGLLAQLLKKKDQHISLFPIWCEWLGFQDRFSHIKAQLRSNTVVSKGGSNVWIVRYVLLCLERKLHSVLNRVF